MPYNMSLLIEMYTLKIWESLTFEPINTSIFTFKMLFPDNNNQEYVDLLQICVVHSTVRF